MGSNLATTFIIMGGSCRMETFTEDENGIWRIECINIKPLYSHIKNFFVGKDQLK